MINKYVTDLAKQMGIKLSHVSIHDEATFSNSNRRSLKILSGGRLVFVPIRSEELTDDIIDEELKKRISKIMANISEST